MDTLRINDKIRINGRPYHIVTNSKFVGGRFNTLGADGDGLIVLGLKEKSTTTQLTTLLHEIIELILVEGNHRYENKVWGDTRYMFCFSHDDFCNIIQYILDSIVSAGLIDTSKSIQIGRDVRKGNGKRGSRKKNNRHGA